MKPWHVVALIAVVAGVIGYTRLGHAAKSTTETIASNALAIPSQASLTVAEQNVQQALPALQSYFTEHGTYAGASATALRSYNGGLSPTLQVVGASATAFCVEDTVDGATADAVSTSGPVAAGRCS